MSKIKIGIIGGSGLTAAELVRLLLNHPNAEIKWIFSKSNAGKNIGELHKDLFFAELPPLFDEMNWDIDLVFSCLPHEVSASFLQETSIPEHIKIIDLSNAFRLTKNNQCGDRKFIYGLPEINKENIIQAQNIANPGCFATAITLSMLPLAKAGLIQNDFHVTGITGSTGAGKGMSATTHFTWRESNVSFYKEFSHQHEYEIMETLSSAGASKNAKMNFLPMRGNFTRGILTASYFDSDMALEEIINIFSAFYAHSPFVKISDAPIDLKQVVNTNFCLLNIQKKGNKILITAAIDNLIKGASGQAIQNMNLMFNLTETSGLQLKASAY